MTKLKKKTIYIYIIIIVALYIVISVIPSLTGALTRTETLEYGDLKVKDQVTCWIIRTETVYSAPYSGSIKYKVSEGDLLKKGAQVLTMTKTDSTEKQDSGSSGSEYSEYEKRLGKSMVKDTSFNAAMRGIFSCYIDGYENYFTPSRMEKLKYDKVKKLNIEGRNISRKNAKAGEPVYKIADSGEWYMAFWVESGDIAKYKQNAAITAELPAGDVRGEVYKLIKDGNRWLILVRSTRYYKDFAKNREIDGHMVTTNKRGLLISNSALTTKKGVVGAYVKQTTGDYKFVPVKTIASNGENTLVKENTYYDSDGNPIDTVKVYDEVLKNPEAEQ